MSAVIGAIFMAAAVLLAIASFNGFSTSQTLRVATWWSCGSIIAMGVTLVILGCLGRRSGGFIPFALLGLVLTFTLVTLSVGTGYAVLTSTRDTSGFTRIAVATHTSMGSTPAEMRTYERGILFDGSDRRQASMSTAVIDLSNYALNNPKRTAKPDHDTEQKQSACPSGTVRLGILETKTTIIMPTSCAYSVNGSQARTQTRSSVGGTFVMLGNNDMLSLHSWTNIDDQGSDSSNDAASHDILHISTPAMIDAELTVTYAR